MAPGSFNPAGRSLGAVVALVWLAGAVVLAACGQDGPALKPASSAPPLPAAPPAAPGSPTVQTSSPAECNAAAHQSGRGCDMNGIMEAVRPLRKPGAAVQLCYLKHVTPESRGRVLLRFYLTPEGLPTGFEVTKNDFASGSLAPCLIRALESISYPAPGDVPCQVVYPFSFVPEVKHGSP